MATTWQRSIDAHRGEVRDATLDAAAALVVAHGIRGVTMSEIAHLAGIGRATLYRYFSDVESILLAWHERQVRRHLRLLSDVRDGAGDASERLSAVLETFALIVHEHHGTELSALVHRAEHVNDAQRHLHRFVRVLIAEAVEGGLIRSDVTPDELSTYSLHAITAVEDLPSKAAVRRLVRLILSGLGVNDEAH